jgi:hypothetical protein
MSKSLSSSSSSGIGFLGVLTIVFITLKLLDKIDWSWWWVLSPILIPMAIVATISLGVLSVVSIKILIDTAKGK